ncbi:MAG: hypothetical protein H7222_16085 [Methylotenera sp.]|nr:hypothetical protein [Oligoflexia bacterium]
MRVSIIPVFLRQLFLGILAVSACACAPERNAAEPSGFKVITTDELVKKEGVPPLSKDVGMPSAPGVELWNYKDPKGQVHSYQIQGPQVVAHQRKPEGREIYLQHWLHLKELRGKTLGKRDLEEKSRMSEKLEAQGGHRAHLRLKEYVWAQTGLTVIYDTSSDRVIQVIQYATH